VGSRPGAETQTAIARSQISLLVEYMPVVLMAIACISIVLTVNTLITAQMRAAKNNNYSTTIYPPMSHEEIMAVANKHNHYMTIALYFLIWLISMGCIGSIASIGMNAIKAQNDLTFDISDRRSTTLRIVLGGLFALVLTLPFGSDCFIDFSYFIGTGMTLKHSDGGVEENLDTWVLMLIAPFLVGFSTSLVIVILDRLMVCAKMLFGQGPSVARELEPTGRQQPIAEIGSRSSPEPKPLS
jgi:hypothetical protein